MTKVTIGKAASSIIFVKVSERRLCTCNHIELVYVTCIYVILFQSGSAGRQHKTQSRITCVREAWVDPVSINSRSPSIRKSNCYISHTNEVDDLLDFYIFSYTICKEIFCGHDAMIIFDDITFSCTG